eukprot:SAG22_NODE_1000_length_6090_cov_9.522117_6_plen_315_part_00
MLAGGHPGYPQYSNDGGYGLYQAPVAENGALIDRDYKQWVASTKELWVRKRSEAKARRAAGGAAGTGGAGGAGGAARGGYAPRRSGGGGGGGGGGGSADHAGLVPMELSEGTPEMQRHTMSRLWLALNATDARSATSILTEHQEMLQGLSETDEQMTEEDYNEMLAGPWDLMVDDPNTRPGPEPPSGHIELEWVPATAGQDASLRVISFELTNIHDSNGQLDGIFAEGLAIQCATSNDASQDVQLFEVRQKAGDDWYSGKLKIWADRANTPPTLAGIFHLVVGDYDGGYWIEVGIRGTRNHGLRGGAGGDDSDD